MSADFLHDFVIPDSITRFKYYAYKILPLVYDDSLSYYELLNKVVYKLNEVITTNESLISNDTALATAYKQLEKYVNDTFDSFDWDAVKDEILEEATQDIEIILRELINSGAIADFLPTPITNLTLNYIGGISWSETPTPPSSMTIINGSTMVYYGANEAHPEYNKLMVMSVDNGSQLAETVINLGHGNDLSYDSVLGCIWAIDSDISNGVYRLFKVNYPNISLANTFTTTYPIKGCQCYDGKLYVYSFGNENGTYKFRLFTVHKSNGVFTEIGNITYPNGNTHLYQGMFIQNDRVFIISTNPDAINEFSITTGNFVQSIPIPLYNNEGIYSGENEGMSLLTNGNICLMSSYVEHGYNTPYVRNRERVMILNEINLEHNLTPNVGARERVAVTEAIQTIHIDNSQQNYKGTGVSGNPYSSLLFATACKKSPFVSYAYSIDDASRNTSLFIPNQECILNLRYANCEVLPYFSKVIIQSRFTVDGVATSFPYNLNAQYSTIRNVTQSNIISNTYHANNFYLNIGDTVQASANMQGNDNYILVGQENKIPLYCFAKITVVTSSGSANFMCFSEASVQWLSAPVNSSHNDTMFIRVNRIGTTNFIEVTNAMVNTTNVTITNVTYKTLYIRG